jgi:hypothetical protein
VTLKNRFKALKPSPVHLFISPPHTLLDMPRTSSNAVSLVSDNYSVCSAVWPDLYSRPLFKPRRLHCPVPRCDATFKPTRLQDVKRHVLSHHLPYAFFCPIPSCRWRSGREDDYKAHLEKHHPDHDERQPGQIYDKVLFLQYIFEDHVPVARAEKYALDFVAERARELGKEVEWDDLCGRRRKTSRCRCNNQ